MATGEEKNRLGAWRIVRILYRTFFIQALWTYEKMLSVGYTVCLLPFISEAALTRDQIKAFLKSNLQYFNTHPYMASWLIGASLKLESDNAGDASVKHRERFRKRASELLAAVGDQFFWNTLKPLTALCGVIVALVAGPIGVVVFLLTYNLPHFYHRIAGFFLGYRAGLDIFKYVSMKSYSRKLSWLRNLGSMVAGAGVVIAANSEALATGKEQMVFALCLPATYFLLKVRLPVPVILLVLLSCCFVLSMLVDMNWS